MNLRRIEIREANLDPLIGVGGPANAKAIAVAHVPDGAEELRSGLEWQRRFARIRIGGRDGADDDKHTPKNDQRPAHAAALNALLPFFFFRSARTNLSQSTMPARFSGM